MSGLFYLRCFLKFVLMRSPLNNFLSKYADLPDDQLDAIAARFKQKKVRKNTFLLQPGEVCKDLIFVQKGCLRLFYTVDAVEVSVWFAFNESSAIDVSSFISGKSSDYFIQAIEDSEILVLSKAELQKFYKVYPEMQELVRRFWEDVIIHLLNRFTALQKDSAETRYKDLLSKPEYMQRIPQKYLASFIGVTPTSLSRIRRKIK